MNIIYIYMANKEHLKILKQGISAWNKWREENPGIQPNLSDIELEDIDLSKANLKGTDFRGSDLREVKLDLSDLRGSNFRAADLKGAFLMGANLGGAYLREVDCRGVDLSGADLKRLYIRDSNFSEAVLREATLYEAVLNNVDFNEADLSLADLSKAELTNVDFSLAILHKVNFFAASLYQVNFNLANCKGVNFSQVVFFQNVFGNTDLSDARALESCLHLGPSTIDFQTISKSWPVSMLFLRGCGAPESFTEKLSSIIEHQVRYQSCYIIYSTEDQNFINQFFKDLQVNGIRCWLCPDLVKPGDKTRELIEKVVDLQNRLIFIISEKSLENNWFRNEFDKALAKEKKRQPEDFSIHLICIDDSFKQKQTIWLAKIINSRDIEDFRNWQKSRKYRNSLERLLKNLES